MASVSTSTSMRMTTRDRVRLRYDWAWGGWERQRWRQCRWGDDWAIRGSRISSSVYDPFFCYRKTVTNWPRSWKASTSTIEIFASWKYSVYHGCISLDGLRTIYEKDPWSKDHPYKRPKCEEQSKHVTNLGPLHRETTVIDTMTFSVMFISIIKIRHTWLISHPEICRYQHSNSNMLSYSNKIS